MQLNLLPSKYMLPRKCFLGLYCRSLKTNDITENHKTDTIKLYVEKDANDEKRKINVRDVYLLFTY